MNSQDMFLGAMNTESSTETMKAEILLVFITSYISIVRSIGHIGNPGLFEPEERRTLSYQPKPDG